MSWMEAQAPECAGSACSVLELVVVPKPRDIGGFSVSRVLPSARRRAVGPFVFFDEMGPAVLPPGQGIDVRPHPHIGLSTITYLFRGEITHRDSLGTVQRIRPGAVNWMTAGRGIVHSERSPDDQRAAESELSGIQAWVALPKGHEEVAPGFVHLDATELPELEGEGCLVRLIAGTLEGRTSPLRTEAEMIYADAAMAAGSSLEINADYPERGLYLVSGEVEIAGDRFAAGELLVLRSGLGVRVRALRESRLMLVGGEPLDGPRHLWWNFVASDRERIEQAKVDWRSGRFPAVPGEHEFIPLPE